MSFLLKALGPLLLSITLGSACSPTAATTRSLHLGSVAFHTEVANTPETRERGLMGRQDLTDEMAMIFVFPDEATRIFWMKDTPTALSIAYVSKRGVIKEILDMEAFSLAAVPSRYSVQFAVEVRKGAFERRGVKVGDQIPPEELSLLSADR